MISASPIAGCPSFKFLTMQMQPSASCARMWTVLSATIMFADKPHRLNERTSAQRFCVLTILPPVPHSRLGYPRSGLSRSDFVLWHKADVPFASTNVCCWGNSGHVLEMPPLPFLAQLGYLENSLGVYCPATATRLSISLRSATKSMGLVSSVSAPPSRAFRLV